MPTTTAFHDITTRLTPPCNLRSLLGLNLKFIPNPQRNTSWARFKEETFSRFDRDLKVKVFIAGKEADELYSPNMCIHSDWTPQDRKIPLEIHHRLAAFKVALIGMLKSRSCARNFIIHQRRALNSLCNQHDFLVVQCDKNLGPAIIERD
jgi:hypothetical protein